MNQRYFFGLDIGGTRTKIGLVDSAVGKVLASDILPTQKREEEAFYSDLERVIGKQIANTKISCETIGGIGVVIGSFVRDGVVDTMCGFIDFMEDYPLGRKLSARLGWPCLVENDARGICYGESLYGAGAGYKRVLLLTLGTGVGVGFTADGQFPESEAVIHMAGHIMVRGEEDAKSCLDSEGCYCSVKGCLESTCSGTALKKLARAEVLADMDNERLFRLAQSGDREAAACVEWYRKMLSRGLNQYVYLFSPDVIILGGGVAHGLKPWLEELNQAVTARVYTGQRVSVVLAGLKEEGGILGAAALFRKCIGIAPMQEGCGYDR